MDKEKRDKAYAGVLRESFEKARDIVVADPHRRNEAIDVHDQQRKILAQWVVEARRDALSAANELIAFRKQATNDLKQFNDKFNRLYDRKEKLEEMGFIITEEEVDSSG